ncbi:MAG: 1-acyl-sn-glycerol-3-phosphate acyltransferase [Gemmatimonadaceae bacterium]
MIYGLLKWITGIALHWFYSDIRVVGRDRIPAEGPLFIAVNHQNALVDSLIVGWIVPRRLAMTAKATLADNPLIALLFRLIGVVPLRRASDEINKRIASPPDRARNAGAFREIMKLLYHGGAILIFPEGKSHDNVGLEPLKSGLARVALQARDEKSIRGIRILPLGLTFEDKATPASVVGVRVGDVIEMDSWVGSDHTMLTAEIARRLRSISEEAGLPIQGITNAARGDAARGRKGLIALAAAWGRLTHRLPIKLARKIAIRRSTNADQPAMFTIMFGIGFALITYAVHLAIIGALVHSLWIESLYVAGLLSGAYWAAFENRPRRY